MATTKNPHSRFYGLLAQLPRADKEDLIWKYSRTVTTSLSEFYRKMPAEYAKMINDMQEMVDSLKVTKINTGAETDRAIEDEKRRFRHFIFRKFNDYGIVVKNYDYSEINGIIQDWAKTDKTMKTMSLDELKSLSRQVHKIVDWHKTKQEKISHLAHCN